MNDVVNSSNALFFLLIAEDTTLHVQYDYIDIAREIINTELCFIIIVNKTQMVM